jgi:hypothetical protein
MINVDLPPVSVHGGAMQTDALLAALWNDLGGSSAHLDEVSTTGPAMVLP